MRVSHQKQFDFYVQQIQSAHSRYLDAQKQVLTGRKFEVPSEDPTGANLVSSANALLARTRQLDDNLRAAKDYLGNTDLAFEEMSSLLNKVNTLAINGANSTYDQVTRDSLASQVDEIQNRLVYLANTVGANGQYIFAGQQTDTKPFTENPPNLVFNGDEDPVVVEIRPNETMRVNLAGAGGFFAGIYDTLESLKNDLYSGNLSNIGDTDLAAIQGHIREVNVTRGELGTKLQTVKALADENLRRMDDLSMKISDTQDTDLSEAITRMQSAQTAYTAALQVTALGQGLSLMDYLR